MNTSIKQRTKRELKQDTARTSGNKYQSHKHARKENNEKKKKKKEKHSNGRDKNTATHKQQETAHTTTSLTQTKHYIYSEIYDADKGGGTLTQKWKNTTKIHETKTHTTNKKQTQATSGKKTTYKHKNKP